MARFVRWGLLGEGLGLTKDGELSPRLSSSPEETLTLADVEASLTLCKGSTSVFPDAIGDTTAFCTRVIGAGVSVTHLEDGAIRTPEPDDT